MTRRNRAFFLVGLAVALVLAGLVSLYASESPDGLEKVAAKHGITATEHNHHDHDAGGSPLAGYATKGVDDERLSGAVAGVVGVGLTLAMATGVFLMVKRRDGSADGQAQPVEAEGRAE